MRARMSAALLAQALALATAAGVSTYGTVALLGIAARVGWIHALPPALEPVTSWWVIALAGTLYVVEFLATLIPGIATAWESVHSAIRPVAGAALAAATVGGYANPAFALLAALLGGTLAFGTHATKLGARMAIDTSPEPVTNGIANVAELGLFTTLALAAWQHPYLALALAVSALVATALLVRAAYRAVRRLFGRRQA